MRTIIDLLIIRSEEADDDGLGHGPRREWRSGAGRGGRGEAVVAGLWVILLPYCTCSASTRDHCLAGLG